MSQADFLPALHAYLHRVAKAPKDAPDGGSAPDVIDPRWSRSLFLQLLQRIEDTQPSNDLLTASLSRLLHDWQKGDRVVVFVRELRRLLREGLAFQADEAHIQKLLEVGLARCIGFPDALPSKVQTLELDRLVAIAKQISDQSHGVFVGMDILRYAAANQLVVTQEGRKQVSALGRVVAKLQGKDAVRWLLQIESWQALGPNDPDRLSRDAAAALLAAGSWEEFPGSDERDDGPCHPDTAERLRCLNLLEQVFSTPNADGWDPSTWHVTPLGRELLSEIAQGTESPLSLLAESLCRDLLSATLTPASASRAPLVPSAADATARQARMVAHEIRNSLLPVQAAMDSLVADLRVLPVDEALQRRQSTIEGGLRHALSFTRQLLQVAELGAKPAARFDPVQGINEVIQRINEPAPVHIEFHLAIADNGMSPPLLLGNRERFDLALRELLRNAIQHGGADLRRIVIQLQRRSGETGLFLHIDDDGCGVPESERDRIFEAGVSQRGKGTGLGLSFVRQVIEVELSGTVVCTQSSLGGARFALQLPAVTADAPATHRSPALPRKDPRP